MESIVQQGKECYICGRTDSLHLHHIFFGTSNRKVSDKHGMTCYLCMDHHTGSQGVHRNKALDMFLKQTAQNIYEDNVGTREQFRQLFGKSYL